MKLKTLVLTLMAVALIAPGVRAQDDTLVIRGGRIHSLTDAGVAIDNGIIVIRDGHIVAVGGAETPIPAGAEIIDAAGSQVYPGLFDAVTRIGLTEIGAVDVTSDFSELGDNNAHLQGATAVHPASEIIPVTRANGITHTVAAPSGAGIAGQGSLINLDGWTIEEMIVDPGLYMTVQWPSLRTRGFDRATRTAFNRTFSEAQSEYDEQIGKLEQLLDDARRYDQASDVAHRELKLEALARVATGAIPFLISVNEKRGIRDAVAFAARNDVRVVISGGRDAWKVAELLAENDIAVILGPTQSVPAGEDDAYDAVYAHPGKLHDAGVNFGISTFNASSARTLPYEAGQAVAFGLPHLEAVKAITRYPAEIFGVGDQLGTLEAGKVANIIITDGDPLEIQTQIEVLIINGRVVDTDNKHQRLYEKYRARPHRDSE